jgi:hypothetical protein
MIAARVRIRQDDSPLRNAVNQTPTAAFKLCSSLAHKSEPTSPFPIAQEVFSMRRALTVLGLTTMLAAAAASFVVLPNGTSRAAATTADDATFVISANDGYGLGDCLASGNDCGRIVANAWCEAQGFRSAASFGLAQAEDVTGAIEVSYVETARPIAITCER